MEYLKPEFDRELLNKSSREKLEYFFELTRNHPALKRVHDDIIHAIRETKRASLILVPGPSGAGKTTLCKGIEKEIIKSALCEMEQDRGMIPVTRQEVEMPEASQFDWVGFFWSQLELLKEPMLDFKVDIDKAYAVANLMSQYGKQMRKTFKYRKAYIDALKNRHCQVALLDEGQHFTKVASGRRLKDQFDYIKSIANQSGVPHVLVGTYELLQFVNLSGQLARRTKVVHFGRYHAEYETEKNDFINILLTLLRQLPIEKVPNDLSCDWEFFYMHSIGCVGILKDWLYESLADSLRNGSNVLTRKSLQRTALGINELQTLLREANEGERFLAANNSALNKLKQELGLVKDPERPANPNNKHRRRRVGERNPVRDKVGLSDMADNMAEKIA